MQLNEYISPYPCVDNGTMVAEASQACHGLPHVTQHHLDQQLAGLKIAQTPNRSPGCDDGDDITLTGASPRKRSGPPAERTAELQPNENFTQVSIRSP